MLAFWNVGSMRVEAVMDLCSVVSLESDTMPCPWWKFNEYLLNERIHAWMNGQMRSTDVIGLGISAVAWRVNSHLQWPMTSPTGLVGCSWEGVENRTSPEFPDRRSQVTEINLELVPNATGVLHGWPLLGLYPSPQLSRSKGGLGFQMHPWTIRALPMELCMGSWACPLVPVSVGS